MSETIRVVLVDDHPVVRQGLRHMIESDSGLVVVGDAGDGHAGLAMIRSLRPDVAVLDIDLPGLDGFGIVRSLQEDAIEVGIVILTMHGESELLESAIDLGIGGYVLKDSAATDIVASIKAVASGRPYLSPAASALLVERRRREEDLERSRPALQSLTPTERRVLKLISEDRTTREIAETLFISPRTVETHRSNICRKLGLSGSLALLKFALANRSAL